MMTKPEVRNRVVNDIELAIEQGGSSASRL